MPTLSPSMDIQVSSNHERLLFELSGRDGAAHRRAARSGSGPRRRSRRPHDDRFQARHDRRRARPSPRSAHVHDDDRRAHRPAHRRRASAAAVPQRRSADVPMVALATAHPAKFPDAVEQATGIRPAAARAPRRPVRARGALRLAPQRPRRRPRPRPRRHRLTAPQPITQSSLPSGSARVTQRCSPSSCRWSTVAPRATRRSTSAAGSAAPTSRCTRFFATFGLRHPLEEQARVARALDQHGGVVLDVGDAEGAEALQLGVVVGRHGVPVEHGGPEPGERSRMPAVEHDVVQEGHDHSVVPTTVATMDRQTIVVLDMEGVLVPEIWIAVAERTGIDALRRTTRDEPDYDALMRYRLDLLAEHELSDVAHRRGDRGPRSAARGGRVPRRLRAQRPGRDPVRHLRAVRGGARPEARAPASSSATAWRSTPAPIGSPATASAWPTRSGPPSRRSVRSSTACWPPATPTTTRRCCSPPTPATSSTRRPTSSPSSPSSRPSTTSTPCSPASRLVRIVAHVLARDRPPGGRIAERQTSTDRAVVQL